MPCCCMCSGVVLVEDHSDHSADQAAGEWLLIQAESVEAVAKSLESDAVPFAMPSPSCLQTLDPDGNPIHVVSM